MPRGYFSPNIPAPRMPKSPDPTGIKWSGDVLQGNLSTNEAFALDRLVASIRSNQTASHHSEEMDRILNFRDSFGR